MENILKKLMSTRCVSMHNPSMRCHGKGCDGQCAQFQAALMAIKEKTTEAQKSFVESMTLYNSEQDFNNCENS